MEQHDNRAQQLLDTFFQVSQLHAHYFDRSLNSISCHTPTSSLSDLKILSMGQIENFLMNHFETKAICKDYFTYFLNNNFVCNIVFIKDQEAYCGAVVTQPVMVNAIRSSDIDEMIKHISLVPAERDSYKRALLRAPVIPYDRIMPMGEVLCLLSRSIFEEVRPRQILKGGDVEPSMNQFNQSGILSTREHQPVTKERHHSYATYLQIKECITKGDADGIWEAIHTINAGSIPLDQREQRSFVRTLKNSFIKALAMSSYTAVEAGASYTKTMALADDFIIQVETLENINDIYELMKSALLAFTRAVALTRITSYSKQVRMVIEYIEHHYAEKITLGMLSAHVNLSESYLSSLIKKETGMNMADNINKIRIEISKKILLNTSPNISELAAMVGFTYSNHFTRIFKQFTGMTPSDFQKSVSAKGAGAAQSPDVLRLISDQLGHMMSVFPGIFDVARIVDPSLNVSWIQQSNGEVVQSTCYNFWSRRQSCKACVSTMALEQDRTFIKLHQTPSSSYFVIAAPLLIGNHKYVLELLKNIADNDYHSITSEPG